MISTIGDLLNVFTPRMRVFYKNYGIGAGRCAWIDYPDQRYVNDKDYELDIALWDFVYSHELVTTETKVVSSDFYIICRLKLKALEKRWARWKPLFQ